METQLFLHEANFICNLFNPPFAQHVCFRCLTIDLSNCNNAQRLCGFWKLCRCAHTLADFSVRRRRVWSNDGSKMSNICRMLLLSSSDSQIMAITSLDQVISAPMKPLQITAQSSIVAKGHSCCVQEIRDSWHTNRLVLKSSSVRLCPSRALVYLLDGPKRR